MSIHRRCIAVVAFVLAAASCAGESRPVMEPEDEEEPATGGRGGNGGARGGQADAAARAGGAGGGSPTMVMGGSGGGGGGAGGAIVDAGGARDVASPAVDAEAPRDAGRAQDTAPPTSNGRKVLLVLKFMDAALTLYPGDEAVRGWLAEKGYTVQPMSQDMANAASASGVQLVVISASADVPKVSNKFAAVAVPTLVLEPGVYGAMGLTTEMAAGFTAVAGPITVMAGHALAGGLSGAVDVGMGGSIGWGTPAAGAIRVATLAGGPDMVNLFAYEKDAAMVGRMAPAKRVAFGVAPSLMANGNANLRKLFEAAVGWLVAD